MINKIKNVFNDSDHKEILTKGFSFLFFRIAGLIAGYIFTYLIAVNYGASVNGLVALSFTLLLCISIFGRLGLDVNLIRFYSSIKNGSDVGLFYKVLLIAFLFSSALALSLYAFKDFVVNTIFNKPQLEPYIFWTVITIPLWSIVLVCAGLFRAKKKNNWFAFLNNPGRFIFSLIAFSILILTADSPLNAIKGHFYGVLLLSVLAFIAAANSLNKITLKSPSSSISFLKEAYPMMVSGAILVFLGWADTFILGIFESDSVIGVYNVALKIAALTSFSLQAINSILAPKIAKNFNEGNEMAYKKMIRFSTKINFYITLFIVACIITLHKFILGIFGEEFLAGAVVLIILCIGQLINSLSGSVGLILQMTGYQKVYQKIVLIALIINIALNFILTPIYGATGAAIATVVSISSWNIIGALYLKNKLNIVSYFNFK